MASVKSLGMHPPTGADGQPLTGNYAWDVFSDTNGEDGEDELLTTGNRVLWIRGGTFRKSFDFNLEKDEPVTQALITYFPAADDARDDNKKPRLAKALVVFLKTQAHIFFLSGTSHMVHMPFEVESACAAPRGVIIQRKPRTDNLAPVSLKFPRVPPNSFVSSQLSPLSQRTSTGTTFSIEGLGKPKILPLRLSSTMENMFDTPLESSDSHWPRLVCLTDPLLELGLVISQPDASEKASKRGNSIKSPFLDPAEEILHTETVQGGLVLAVTVNRESNMYTVWQLTYIKNEDLFIGSQKKPKSSANRRRSSMQPGMKSGATSPVPVPSFRESAGVPLPVKKARRSEKPDKSKAVEIALAMDDDKGAENTRRQSRRVSSLLARADLSATHERSTFAEPPLSAGLSGYHGDRRMTSHAAQKGRHSGGVSNPNVNGTFNQSLNSRLEAPVDDLLKELRAGGDFEGFHDMGLEDHDFDGLTREMLLTKIHSTPVDNTNVRYSLSNKPARAQSKVFVLAGPPYAEDERGRQYLLIGVQDPVDKRLQLLTFYIEKQRKFDLAIQTGRKAPPLESEIPKITWGFLRRATNVVDSCKIFDGDQCMILILSENMAGQKELSIQAPWSAMSTLTLPMLYADNLGSLAYTGTHVNREVSGRRSIGIDFTATQLASIRHSRSFGVVDLQCKEGKIHRIQVQLQPTTPQVRKVLQVCRSILPPSYGEKMLAGWWHIMKWLEEQPADIADKEWSSVVIQLFAIFLALGHMDASTLTEPKMEPRSRRSGSHGGGSFDRMQLYITPNGAACPSWMHSPSWQWTADGQTTPTGIKASPVGDGFLFSHIVLAKRYMVSSPGQVAIGPTGYFPTAFHLSLEDRRKAAWALALGLHLLLEEQKLDVMSPEHLAPGRVGLRVVLCQIGRWLGWNDFVALHELGMQADLDPRNDNELGPMSLPNPPSPTSVYDWVQSQLTGDKSVNFSTISDIYNAATQDYGLETGKDPRHWSAVTPRTLMFKRFFSLLTPTSNHLEIVELMHRCGFTVDILESLPEAVLIPLRDAVFRCQARPPTTWSKELLSMVHRSDISMMLKRNKRVLTSATDTAAPSHTATWDYRMICHNLDKPHAGSDEDESLVERVVEALFKDDRRLPEARKLLTTGQVRTVHYEQLPGNSDAEYLELQKEMVLTFAYGTLAIPAGRGLLNYGLRYPLLTQKYHIPGFNLTCLVKPSNNTVTVDKSFFTEEKIDWAFFHQGATSGLSISPSAKGIDHSWILYNKPPPPHDWSNRHAGFLLGLGLNGHLRSVAKWVAFKYLTPKHQMTSIGMLLGLSVTFRGTMHSLTTRLLSVHVTRMLPPGAAELNLTHHTQTAGIMGFGLLYCNSQHRRYSEIMLSEIGHMGDEDEEDPLRGEGYRLAAGFALGFINLGKGVDLKGLQDVRVTEKLLTLASATKKVEVVNALDRSAAGAVVAIALIFMKSEDHIVARKVDVPDSVLQYGYVRPDILLLRTLAKNLIMWKGIEPTLTWIKSSLPREYRWRHLLSGPDRLRSKDMPFYSILAGLLFSIGLRYAGSANVQVRDLLIHYLDNFIRVAQLTAETYDAKLTQSNVRMCQDIVALSAATVMAGTGDLVVLRRLRSLHGRDDPSTTYGSHMAAHLAIGALFLGNGTMTFSTSNLAIASLLVAFYPLFPTSVQDNRAHLQAFRHFWVLATDPRCLVTKDINTGQPVSVPILIELKAPPIDLDAHMAQLRRVQEQLRLKTLERDEVVEALTPDLLSNPFVKAETRRRKTEQRPITKMSSLPEEITTSATASPSKTSPFKPVAKEPPQTIPTKTQDPTIIRKMTPCLLPPLEDIASVRTDASAQGYWNLELEFGKRPWLIEDFRKNQSLHLRQRPMHEGAFNATVRALGRDALPESVVDHSHHNLAGGRGGGAGKASTAARHMEHPLEWVFNQPALAGLTHAERAMVLDRSAGGGEGGSGEEATTTEVDAMLALQAGMDGWSRDGLEGLRLLFEWADKRSVTGPSAQGDAQARRTSEMKKDDPVGESWWMRDSVVEMLKGKAWLAAREEEG